MLGEMFDQLKPLRVQPIWPTSRFTFLYALYDRGEFRVIYSPCWSLVRVSVLRASLVGVLRGSLVRVGVLRASLVGVLRASLVGVLRASLVGVLLASLVRVVVLRASLVRVGVMSRWLCR